MSVKDTVAIAEARVRVARGDLAAIRTRAKLSQNAIAGAVGVNRIAVLRWERGERLPTGEPAVRLAKLLRDLEKVAGKAPSIDDPGR